jgi:hypothetical protein
VVDVLTALTYLNEPYAELNLQSPSVVVPRLVNKTDSVSVSSTESRSLSVSSTGSQDVFKEQLVRRDKTSRYKNDIASRGCDACHLVPFSKGEVVGTSFVILTVRG